MSKPDDVPDDVWKEAVIALHDTWDNPPLVLARVIMAERERCAEVAEALETVIPMWDRPGGPPGNGPMRHGTPKEIAAAIRKGEA